MHRRDLVPLSALAVVVGLVSVAVSLTGQSPPAPSKSTTAKLTARNTTAKAGVAPHTPWGDPDLQGTWFVLWDVPLERSAANAGKEFLTDAERAAADAKKEVNPGRNARSEDRGQDVSGAYNAVFNSVLRTGKRTSMIIDPPDGRIPRLVPGAVAPAGRGGANAANRNDNPETLQRCLGVPMPFVPLNTLFAQGTVMQIVQSPKSMGIYMEDDHAGGGNRIIYMDGRPHPLLQVKFYLGHSVGHWEGNSLVIETTNFSQGFRGSNIDTYKMIERITRVDADNLRREITFDDPKTWTRRWTVLIEMGRAPDGRHMIFDSACHEGNYGLVGILSGTRKEEQQQQAGR